MPLTGLQTLKFDIYSLFCHHLVGRVRNIREALVDRKGDIDVILFRECVEKFDSALTKLFETPAITRKQAFDLIARKVNDIGDDAELTYAGAKRSFEAVIEDARRDEPQWSYQIAIQQCHQQGRRLAQLFYQNSPSAHTQRRTSLQATLRYEYGNPSIEELARAMSASLKDPDLQEQIKLLIPKLTASVKHDLREQRAFLYTFEQLQNNEYLIVIPFSDNHNFMHYAAYPFLFLHEYSAHIFSTDYNNDLFNDGWLIYAASDFLISQWRNDPELDFLTREQVFAFKESLYHQLAGGPQERHNQAEQFYLFVRPWGSTWFNRIIFELAAFLPTNGQSKTWPTTVLRTLSREQETARSRTLLKHKLLGATDLRSIYP